MKSDSISYEDFIWNDKRNVSEVLNEEAGFFVNNKGLGMYNKIYYNNFYDQEIGFSRDGIQVNNGWMGIFDPELISINEIQKIEEVSNISSFIYGINSHGKAINIITKDRFGAKPFSQLRYSQDRYGSLFADASFSIPFSRKFNFLIRANNHSLDGRYTNSNFSAWRADGRASWFPSTLWNFKLDFNYAKISRGLNDGLNFYGLDLGNQGAINNLIDVKAPVLDPAGNDVNENYNTSLTAYSTAFGANSLAMLQLYLTHYYRNFGGKRYSLDTIPYYINDFYNTRTIGVNLKYNKKIIWGSSQKMDLTLLNNYYFNNYNIDYAFFNDNSRLFQGGDLNFGFLSGKMDYSGKSFFLSAFLKSGQYFADDYNKNFVSYGGEMKLSLIENEKMKLQIFAGANKINDLNYYPQRIYRYVFHTENFESGLDFSFSKLNMLAAYNYNTDDSRIKFNLNFGYGAFNLKSENSFKIKDYENSLPVFSKNDFSYRNKFFSNKLDLKMGVNFKFILNYRFYAEDYYKTIEDRYYSGNTELDPVYYNNFNNKFIADFYIGARIGHANVNFTVANIFNNFYYDTFMFPADDRGGFVNAVSRFTIVWDFIN